jgi:hypothetical protein
MFTEGKNIISHQLERQLPVVNFIRQMAGQLLMSCWKGKYT